MSDTYEEHRLWSTADITLYVLQYLDTATLSRTVSVSQFFREVSRTELRRRVRVVLSKHIAACLLDSFFDMLQSSASVISGSMAFAVLSWGSDVHFASWRKPGDLDIYVPRGKTSNFVQFFAEHTTFIPAVPADSSSLRRYGYPQGIRTVTTLLGLPERIPLALLSIDIVESEEICATSPLQNFWGTAVNNYITSSSIVSAYPRTTFANVCLVHPWVTGRRVAHEKYRKRGVEIVKERGRVQEFFKSTETFDKDYLVLDFGNERVGKPSVLRVCSSLYVDLSWRLVNWVYE